MTYSQPLGHVEVMDASGPANEGTTTASTGSAGERWALVFAGDERFAIGLAVAMYSAVANLAPTVAPEIFVLDNGLTEPSRRRLVRVLKCARPASELRWMQVARDRLEHLRSDSRLPPAAYSRLLIPELLPAPVSRAVYVDADIVVKGDLGPLFSIDLDGAAFGAVRDFRILGTGHYSGGARGDQEPGPYFNTGVLVMDVSHWRTNGLASRALEYAAAATVQLAHADQDALNAVGAEAWKELEYHWNVQHVNLLLPEPVAGNEFTDRLYRQRWELYRNAVAIHFVGGGKPWQYWCNLPGTAAWVRTLLRSGWYTRTEGTMWLLEWLSRRAAHGLRLAGARIWRRLRA